MHAIKKSTNRFHESMCGALRHALVVSLLTFGVLPIARAAIIGGSVETGTTIAPTGDGLCSLDPSTMDMNVCTNGQVTYSLEFVGNGGDDPVTLTSQLPVGAVWEMLPPSCSGPGSGISADGRTLTCVYPGPVAAGTVRILPTARISGALANGTQLPAPVTTFTSPQTPAPVVATDLSGTLTVLAKPGYDLIKATHSSPLQSYPGPNGEAGYLLRYSIMISVPAGSVQGQENLVQPIVVTDIVPANAALVEWGAGAPYTCHANSSAIPAYYTGNTNYPPGTGGTCDATQAGAGAPATLTLSGMNLTSGFQSYGNFVADFNLLLWIPASSLLPGNNVLTNSISWSPESISGQDNVDPDLGNQTVNDQVNNDPTVVRGNFEKYFNVAPYDGNGRLPADSTGSLLIYTRNPAITQQEKVLCEKYDNTRYQITAAGASMAVAGAVIEYGTGGLGGAGQTWASENDQRIGTCADDQSPAWHANLASVPGGLAAVTKIRARYLAPSGDSIFQAYFRVLGAYAFNGYATNNGPAIAGQAIPVGEKMINWTALQVVGATAATYDQADDQAVQDSDGRWWGISRTTDPVASVYGDTLYVARAIASVTKSLLPANSPDVVAAGSVATYRLQPTLDTMNGVVGSTPTSVTLRDVLPPGLGYQPGTASIGEPSVQADVPASGYTTLVWTLDNVLPGAPLPPVDYQVLVDSFVQNSRILPNLVEVSSPLDPETCAKSSGIYAGMLGNAVINSDTGAVGGTLCQRAARHDMSVSNPGGLQLQKTSDTPVISSNGTLQYTLTWGGIQSSVDRTDLIDLLPYNGDGRTPATNYNGGVAGTANLHLENLVGPVTNDGSPASLFYYTSAASATIAPDPGHPSNALPGGSTRWCTSAEFGMAGCPASKDQATAFRVVSGGVLASNTMRSVTVVLRTGGNRAGNVYTNAFNMRGTVDGQPLVALLDSNAVSAVTQAADVTVRKVLTTGGPTAEPGETLGYTITLTNNTGTPATDHAFYESIPAYTSYQSVTGATVAGCTAGDAGRKTCTLIVASIPANATAEVVLNVQVANALPAGLTQLYNLVTDGVCDPADATCAPPPVCDPATDANQCITPPTGCDPATDPDHCVVTPVEPPLPPIGSCPADPYIIKNENPSGVYSFDLATGAQTLIANLNNVVSGNAIGFRQQDGYIYGWVNTPEAERRLVRIGAGGAHEFPFTTAPTGWPRVFASAARSWAGDVSPTTGLYVALVNTRLYFVDVTTNAVVRSVALSGAVTVPDVVTDIAFHPVDGNLYAIYSQTGQVIRINPATGASIVVPGQTLPPTGDSDMYGTVFFDGNGTLYTYKVDGFQYRVFNVDGSGPLTYDLLSSLGGRAPNMDGASCPGQPAGPAAILLRKTTVGEAGGEFQFELTGTTQANGAVTTLAADTATEVDGDSAISGLQAFTALAIGQPVTITESALPNGWSLQNATCAINGVTVGERNGSTYEIPGAAVQAGGLIECDFINAQQPDIAVRKVLTTGGPTAEAGETLSYTITLTNSSATEASNHAFYESIPAYTTFQSVTGATVADCAVGDAGRKTCTLTVASVPANATADVVLTVQVANTLPAGLTQLYNLVTNGVCDPADATCVPPPACDPATDANQCTTPPVGCDPATDPDHCVVTPVTPPPPPFASCPANAFVTRDSNPTSLYDFNLVTGAQNLIGAITGINASNAAGFRQQDGYVYVWANSPATGGGASRRFARVGANGQADYPFATAPTGWPVVAGIVQDAYVADVSPAGLYVALLGSSLYFVDVTTNAVVNVVPLSRAVGGITDMAFHPTDGNLYTVNASNGLVWRIEPNTGAVTELTGITLPTNASGGGYGAIFFDSNGTMYPYKSGGQVYRVFNVDGSGTLSFDLLTGNAPTTSNLDGGACPNLAPMGPPAILLRKTTTGAAGGPFEFTFTGTTQANGTVTTQAADTPVEVDGNSALDGIQTFTAAAIGQAVTISEAGLPADWSLQGATCVSNGAAVGTFTGTSYEIPGAAVQAGGLIECDFTNAQQPDITVKKVLTTGGPTAEAGETLSYTITLTNNSATVATNHAFYESIPAYTTFQSVTGATAADCAVGDAGRKTCTLTVASVPANGTSEVVLTVEVAATLPAGLTQLYNLVTNGVCDPADSTCVPPPVCDPATDPNQCTTPPVGCDPATDPDHCVITPVIQPNVTVKKALTAESGTRPGIAENAETLTYTLTLTNNGTGAATDHAFYERLPEYTTLVSIDGPGVTHDCAVGDAGPKLCTITVAGPIAADGGTAQASVVLVTDDPLPANVRRIFNLITDNTDQPPTGCDPATQVCTPPPACDPATDPNQCGTPLPGCDPATDPDHCVVTPIDLSSVTVRKQLTGEDGTVEGFVEPGETLTYTLTLTNDGGQSAAEHVFYEQLPAHVTLVGITGTGVSSNCAAGDVGSKLCQVTVLTPIAGDGGTATVTVVVKVADPLPAGVLTLVNLVTDNTDTPPPGCDPLTQICGGDPELPPQCDPATDPAHCVSTPVAALLTVEKSVLGVPQPVTGSGDEFTVRYAVTVRNAGGSTGRYDLSDTPQFDADASVVSAQSTRGQETAVALQGVGPWTLADDRELAAGASDVYTLELRVRVAVGSSQDNDTCVAATPGNGLFNLATLTTAGREESDDACVDTPKPETTTVLVVEKRGSVREAEMGDLVNYTIRIRNNGTGIALLPMLVDRLPAGFRLVEDSARVSGATLVSLDGSPGPVLRLTLDRIDPGAEVQVAYRVRIGVGALEGDGINRAQVECRESPETLATRPCSNEDRWEVDINAGVFSEEGCVVGQVFVDCNYNSIKDREELGIPGVRMYLQDGTFLISDSEGKYSYCGLRPTTHVLKVDSTTLPTRSRMVTSSSRNAGDANSLFIDMKKGELHRADFIEGSCNNEVIEQVKARKAQGEVSSVQTETGQPPLRFESKPLPQSNPTQQGTDSANQRIEQTRHGQAPAANDDAPKTMPETGADGD